MLYFSVLHVETLIEVKTLCEGVRHRHMYTREMLWYEARVIFREPTLELAAQKEAFNPSGTRCQVLYGPGPSKPQ